MTMIRPVAALRAVKLAQRLTHRVVLSSLLLSLSITTSSAQAAIGKVLDRPDAKVFIQEMQDKHDFDRTELTELFSKVKLRQDIVDLMNRPAESKPWKDYRKIFMTQQRADGGKEFCRDNAHWLGRAEEVYGIPPEIITAFIGVETRYGNVLGRHRVIDALSTLAFAYPKRAKFFRKELEQFLILAREENWDPLKPKGSYAGAMGWGQFIPSSYRHYAIDFDKDGHRDLWGSKADIIGSIASYLDRHGWRQGGLVALPAQVSGNAYKTLKREGLKPKLTTRELADKGITSAAGASDAKALYMKLDADKGTEHWLGFHNFYVITRYNHSHRYAMVIHQLSKQIREGCLTLAERDALNK